MCKLEWSSDRSSSLSALKLKLFASLVKWCAAHYTRHMKCHVSLRVVCERTHRFRKITSSVNEPKSDHPGTNHGTHFPCIFRNGCVKEAWVSRLSFTLMHLIKASYTTFKVSIILNSSCSPLESNPWPRSTHALQEANAAHNLYTTMSYLYNLYEVSSLFEMSKHYSSMNSSSSEKVHLLLSLTSKSSHIFV